MIDGVVVIKCCGNGMEHRLTLAYIHYCLYVIVCMNAIRAYYLTLPSSQFGLMHASFIFTITATSRRYSLSSNERTDGGTQIPAIILQPEELVICT